MSQQSEPPLVATIAGRCRRCERRVVGRARKVDGRHDSGLWVRCGRCETPVPARWARNLDGNQGGVEA